MKVIQNLFPPARQSNFPDYISIQDACAKYKTSHVNINSKIKMFEKENRRQIDRLQSGKFKLINERELQQALRIKGPQLHFFKS